MKIIDGEKIAQQISARASKLIQEQNLKVRLAIIFVGDNSASTVYVAKKMELAARVGIEVVLKRLSSISLQDALALLDELNLDNTIAGIIPQLPMPVDFDTQLLFPRIAPEKDVDGLNPLNLGKIWQGEDVLLGATPRAVFDVLEYVASSEGQETVNYLKGKHVVIINSSNLIGKPLAGALLAKQATVTMCHSQTQNLQELTQRADIIVSATGKRSLINAEMIKTGAVLIDSGFVKTDKHIYGDVDRESVEGKASYLSPVPGGIGPIGVANLMLNTALAASKIAAS